MPPAEEVKFSLEEFVALFGEPPGEAFSVEKYLARVVDPPSLTQWIYAAPQKIHIIRGIEFVPMPVTGRWWSHKSTAGAQFITEGKMEFTVTALIVLPITIGATMKVSSPSRHEQYELTYADRALPGHPIVNWRLLPRE